MSSLPNVLGQIVLRLKGRVSGRWTFLVEILLSCCGRSGCHWHFLAPLACVIPHADSCTIICAVRQRHLHKSGILLSVMAGDCGDEMPSKSKPQSAGITSCVISENLLDIRYFSSYFVFKLQFCIFLVEILSPNVSFHFVFREFREFSSNSLFKPCMFLIMGHCTC